MPTCGLRRFFPGPRLEAVSVCDTWFMTEAKVNGRVTETLRLVLRLFTPADAGFVLQLVNDPDWIRFIGDRNVHTPSDAHAYIQQRLMASYTRHGFGFWLVERKSDGQGLGMCGLFKREGLDDVDIGFAFLPQYRGHGYALESAQASLAFATNTLNLKRVVAITTVDNDRSAHLLEKLGLRFERLIRLPGDNEDVRLFATRAAT